MGMSGSHIMVMDSYEIILAGKRFFLLTLFAQREEGIKGKNLWQLLYLAADRRCLF
jgi:hypothetical protein